MNGPQSSAEAVEELAGELDSLIQQLEHHPDQDVQRLALQLLDRVDALHRLGLTALIEALRDGNAAGPMQRAIDDPPSRFLLQLYDLLPGDDPGPIEIALDEVRSRTVARGDQVALVGVSDGVPRIRATGADAGAIESLRELVVAVLREHFPALQTVRFEEQPRISDDELLSVIVVDRAPVRSWKWFAARAVEEIPTGAIVTDVVAGRKVALWRAGEQVIGARDTCPGSPLPLAAATLAEGELRCPWHDCRFDARTGRRLKGVGESLELFTVAVRDGIVQIEFPDGDAVPEAVGAR